MLDTARWSSQISPSSQVSQTIAPCCAFLPAGLLPCRNFVTGAWRRGKNACSTSTASCITRSAPLIKAMQDLGCISAASGGGDPGSGSGGGDTGTKWQLWRGDGGGGLPSGSKIMLFVLIVLYVFYAGVSKQQEGINSPLPWSDKVAGHLQGLAAEWDLPAASAYAQAIASSENAGSLMVAIDKVIKASEEAGEEDGGDDTAELIAAAVGCVVLSDLSCRALLPRMIALRQDAEFWAARGAPAWRLSVETLSLPLGPTLSARFPWRSLERRLFECKVMQLQADNAAGASAQAVGSLHESLAALKNVHDKKSLRKAVNLNSAALEHLSDCNKKQGTIEASPRDILLRLMRCAEAHPKLLETDTGGFEPGKGRPNVLQRRWPEVLVLLYAGFHMPQVAQPSTLIPAVRDAGLKAYAGARALYRENLQVRGIVFLFPCTL